MQTLNLERCCHRLERKNRHFIQASEVKIDYIPAIEFGHTNLYQLYQFKLNGIHVFEALRLLDIIYHSESEPCEQSSWHGIAEVKKKNTISNLN